MKKYFPNFPALFGRRPKAKEEVRESPNPRYGKPPRSTGIKQQETEELTREFELGVPTKLPQDPQDPQDQEQNNLATENSQAQLSSLAKEAADLKTKLQIASLDAQYRLKLLQELPDFTKKIEELSQVSPNSPEIEQTELVNELSKLFVDMVIPDGEKSVEKLKDATRKLNKDLEAEGLKKDPTKDQEKLIDLLIGALTSPGYSIDDVVELFYVGYKGRLEEVGIKTFGKFAEIVEMAIKNDIENKYITFKDGKFYRKVSDVEGQVVDKQIDYIGDIIKSGEIKQLFNLSKAWDDVLNNTEEGKQKIQEVGMAKKDFLGVMRRMIANNAVIGIRPINKDTKRLIELYEAIGKLFLTKGKSSEFGPLKGIVPYLAWFSKVSKPITQENTFKENLKQVNKFQEKNNLDINRTNREFYKTTLTKIMNLNEEQKKEFYRILDSLKIEVDIPEYNKELLSKIRRYCEEKIKEKIEEETKEKIEEETKEKIEEKIEDNFQNVLDIIIHQDKFRDNEDIRKVLLKTAFEAIKDKDSKQQNIKRQDFIRALNELNVSSKKVFEVKVNIGGEIKDKDYKLYFAEKDGFPLYENNDDQEPNNQRPLFFIKVPENSDEFDLYQYNYNFKAEEANGQAEYVLISDENKKNNYKKILKPVEAFTYCRYKYEEESKEVVETKRIVTADYDMLFAVSKKGFPLELNSPEEIIGELKYHRLKEDMEYSRFVSLLANAANDSSFLTSDDQEFLMARVIESNILSSGDDKKDWERVQRILLVKFGGGQEQIKKVKDSIESQINDLQNKIDEIKQVSKGIGLILQNFGEKEWKYETYKKIVSILMGNPALENTLDKQIDKPELIRLLSEIGLLENGTEELSEQRFQNHQSSFSELKNTQLNEVVAYLEFIRKSKNLDTMMENLEKDLPESSSADLKTTRQAVRQNHVITHYENLLKETQREIQEVNDKFLIDKSEFSKQKYKDTHKKELQSLGELQKLKTLLTLERLIEKLEKEEITKLGIKDVRIIVNELFIDNANDPDFKGLHDLIQGDEINTNELKNLATSLKDQIPNPDKTNWADLKDKMQKLFNGEKIPDADQKSIAEIIADLERYRKSEIIKSETYEFTKGLITMDDWAFIEALTFDAHGNINHGMEYGNPYNEPFTPGNFVFLLPSGEVEIFRTEQEVCDLVNDLRQKGYPVPVNIRWGWVCDKEGKLSIPSKRFDFAKIDKFVDEGKNKDNSAEKASRLSQRFKQAISKVSSIRSSVGKRDAIKRTKSVDSASSQNIEKEIKDLENKLKNFSERNLKTIGYVSSDIKTENLTSENEKTIIEDCKAKIKKLTEELLSQIKTPNNSSEGIKETIFSKNNYLGEIYKNFEIIESNFAFNSSEAKSIRALKKDVLNKMFIDVTPTQEEKDKISEARLEIYALYLHICYLENSPKVVYEEVENYFKSEKDQKRIAKVNTDSLKGIKAKTQDNLNQENDYKIAESKKVLLDKWEEYCELMGGELVFRKTDFDEAFSPVMTTIKNQLAEREPSPNPIIPEGSEGRQALLESIRKVANIK